MRHLYIAIATCAFIAFGAVSCDRGCLSRRLGDSPVASALSVKQDCPTGLARCTEGAVEITEGRAPCPDCPCAWKRVKVCEAGCVVSDVELVRDPAAADSLCKGLQVSATTPVADAGTETCPNEGERFLCRHTQVFACARGSAIPVAVCTHGCADEDEMLSNPEIDIAAATALMCSHDPRALGP